MDFLIGNIINPKQPIEVLHKHKQQLHFPQSTQKETKLVYMCHAQMKNSKETYVIELNTAGLSIHTTLFLTMP